MSKVFSIISINGNLCYIVQSDISWACKKNCASRVSFLLTQCPPIGCRPASPRPLFCNFPLLPRYWPRRRAELGWSRDITDSGKKMSYPIEKNHLIRKRGERSPLSEAQGRFITNSLVCDKVKKCLWRAGKFLWRVTQFWREFEPSINVPGHSVIPNKYSDTLLIDI